MKFIMNEELWEDVDNFDPDEFGCVDMDRIFIYTLQAMRDYVGRKVIVHCGYELRESGYHPKKCAADLHIEGLHVVDQYLVASRFDNFVGIGLYLWWNSPGLHIDRRPKRNKFIPGARWLSVEKGKYLSLTAKNLKLFF